MYYYYFRLCGDLLKCCSIILYWYRIIQHTNHALGISLKTQQLFLVVSITRYIDVFFYYYGFYNTIMKVLYIVNGLSMILMITKHTTIKVTYDHARDTFPYISKLLLPCILLAVITHWYKTNFELIHFSTMETLWIFSIYLESITMLPQLWLLQQYREVDILLATAVVCFGMYRGLYICNWIYRYYSDRTFHHDYIMSICASLQFISHFDFFYCYWKSITNYYYNVATTTNNTSTTAATTTTTTTASSSSSSSSSSLAETNNISDIVVRYQPYMIGSLQNMLVNGGGGCPTVSISSSTNSTNDTNNNDDDNDSEDIGLLPMVTTRHSEITNPTTDKNENENKNEKITTSTTNKITDQLQVTGQSTTKTNR